MCEVQFRDLKGPGSVPIILSTVLGVTLNSRLESQVLPCTGGLEFPKVYFIC